MGDYAGKIDNSVFHYLDSLQPEPAYEDLGYRRQLPDTSNQSAQEKECGAKLLKGLVEILHDEDEKHPKQAISLLHKRLREEYPQFSHNLTC